MNYLAVLYALEEGQAMTDDDLAKRLGLSVDRVKAATEALQVAGHIKVGRVIGSPSQRDCTLAWAFKTHRPPREGGIDLEDVVDQVKRVGQTDLGWLARRYDVSKFSMMAVIEHLEDRCRIPHGTVALMEDEIYDD